MIKPTEQTIFILATEEYFDPETQNWVNTIDKDQNMFDLEYVGPYEDWSREVVIKNINTGDYWITRISSSGDSWGEEPRILSRIEMAEPYVISVTRYRRV